MGSIRGGGVGWSEGGAGGLHIFSQRLTSTRGPALKALPNGLLALSDRYELFKQTAQRMRPVSFHHPLPPSPSITVCVVGIGL